MIEDDDELKASYSNRTIFLNVSHESSYSVPDPFLPMWMSLILVRCDRMSISSFLGSTDAFPTSLSTGALFLSFTRSVSATLSLCAFILALHVKVLSIIVVIRSRYPIFCDFCRYSVQCQRCLIRTTSSMIASPMSADNAWKSYRLIHWNSFNYNPWSWSSNSFSIRCNFFVNFNSGVITCHGVSQRSSQFGAFDASFSDCLVQLVSRKTSILRIRKTASVTKICMQVSHVTQRSQRPSPKLPWIHTEYQSQPIRVGDSGSRKRTRWRGP